MRKPLVSHLRHCDQQFSGKIEHSLFIWTETIPVKMATAPCGCKWLQADHTETSLTGT